MDFDPLQQREMQLEMISMLHALGYVTFAMNLACTAVDSIMLWATMTSYEASEMVTTTAAKTVQSQFVNRPMTEGYTGTATDSVVK
jgi:hypothetical protein